MIREHGPDWDLWPPGSAGGRAAAALVHVQQSKRRQCKRESEQQSVGARWGPRHNSQAKRARHGTARTEGGRRASVAVHHHDLHERTTPRVIDHIAPSVAVAVDSISTMWMWSAPARPRIIARLTPARAWKRQGECFSPTLSGCLTRRTAKPKKAKAGSVRGLYHPSTPACATQDVQQSPARAPRWMDCRLPTRAQGRRWRAAPTPRHAVGARGAVAARSAVSRGGGYLPAAQCSAVVWVADRWLSWATGDNGPGLAITNRPPAVTRTDVLVRAWARGTGAAVGFGMDRPGRPGGVFINRRLGDEDRGGEINRRKCARDIMEMTERYHQVVAACYGAQNQPDRGTWPAVPSGGSPGRPLFRRY